MSLKDVRPGPTPYMAACYQERAHGLLASILNDVCRDSQNEPAIVLAIYESERARQARAWQDAKAAANKLRPGAVPK